MRRIIGSCCALVLLVLFQPTVALADEVPVTVAIDSVTNLTAGDVFGGLPDFYTRVNIGNGGWFESNRIDNTAAITPGWTFTRDVPRSAAAPSTPIRIEIWDYNGSVIVHDLIDVDPAPFAAVCPGADPLFGCAILTIGRPPIDNRGIDISLNLFTAAVTPVTAGGDASSTTACPLLGSEGEAASLCFTITIGSPKLRVTKTADTNDGDCSLLDCSLREAVRAAEDGATIIVPAGTYDLTLGPNDLGNFAPGVPDPGHLSITKANLKIEGPTSGGTAIVKQTRANTRVFDVFGGASVEMSNLTIMGGQAANNSTALPRPRARGRDPQSRVGHAPQRHPYRQYGAQYGRSTVGWRRGRDLRRRRGDFAPLQRHNCRERGCGALGRDRRPRHLHRAEHRRREQPRPGWQLRCTAGRRQRESPVSERDLWSDDRHSDQLPDRGVAAPRRLRAAPGSEAIDNGIGASLPECHETDQLGGPRPLDGDGDGVVRCDSGAMEFDPEGVGVIHQPLDSSTGRRGPVTLIFDNITAAGTTSLATSVGGPAPPAGYRQGSPVAYYDLHTAANFTGSVNVCVNYAGRTFADETSLRLFHHVAGAWLDETLSLDTTTDVVCGRTSSLSVFAIFAPNRPPTAWITEPVGGYIVEEGGGIFLQGHGSDPDGDPLTYRWSPATGLDDANAATPFLSTRDEGNRTYTLVVSDPESSSAPATVSVHVINAAPVVSITAPANGVLFRVGGSVTLTAAFADAGVDDVHTCTVDWDDGTGQQPGVVSESGGAGTCTLSHSFAQAGVYTAAAAISDGDGGAGRAAILVVVYDPTAGFVTGGGWFDSPPGAYTTGPALAGRVVVGFHSKYPGDAVAPTGTTELHLDLPALDFHSTSYEWLVVSGAKAQFKGVGRIGSREYGFLLTAYDGQVPGARSVDRVRIKIWDPTNVARILYDNVLDPGATDDIDTAKPQALGGGSIVIHDLK